MPEYEEAERSHNTSRCPGHPVQRRSHKKSRNGCRNCKQRRIKCDESKPTCKNCSRCSIRCDFSPDNADPAAASALAPRKRGRPLKRKTASYCPPEVDLSDSNPPIHSTSSLTEKFRNPHPLNVKDLQLFHHYVSNVSLTLGDDVLWHDKVPLLAFENPFLLNLILSLSALHLAQLHISEATKYMQLAEVHSSVALPYVTKMLSDINHHNCSALYIATILICGCALAKTPKAGHLVVGEGTEVGWLGLIKGVHSIIDIMGLPAIFSGRLGPFPVENLTKMPPTKSDQGYIPWEEPLSNLAVLIANWEEPEYDFHAIHKALVKCFLCVYGTGQKPDICTHGKIYIVMRWLILLEDGFINQVQLKMPLALIILAHFAVLLQTVECFWYMRGWAHCVIDGVLDHLDPSYCFWISWPKAQVGC